MGARRDTAWLTGGEAELRAGLQAEIARCDAGDPFSCLDVLHDVDDRGVRSAFLQATRLFHPNRFARKSDDVRKLANELFVRLNKAHQAIRTAPQRQALLARLDSADKTPTPVPQRAATLRARARSSAEKTPTPTPTPTKRPPRRRSMEARLRGGRVARAPNPPVRLDVAAHQAEELEAEFRRGLALLRNGQPVAARDLFQDIATKSPGERRYRAYLNFSRAVLLEQADQAEQAAAEYRRALALDPGLAEAEKAIERLRASSRESGFIKRIFRR